ncbi:MAG: c-type cytochrome [Chloroflexi bacterium]|nr:c-type cytochrome [Chloroflexota bacterium]
MAQNTNTEPPQIGCAAGILFGFIGLLLSFLLTVKPLTVSADAARVARAEPSSTPFPTDTPQPTFTATFTLTPTAISTLTPTVAATLTPVPPTSAPATSGVTTAYDPALVAHGQELFVLCTACHGVDARGIPGLGKDLVASEFVIALSDEELLAFIQTGRPVWDAANTTGIDMPPRGGNPAMTDDDIVAIIAYIRTLHAQSG